MKDEFFLDILKEIDPLYEEFDIPTTGFIDTGSYAFNALLSSSIYGGIPNNRSTMIAGEFGTGKTYFALSCVNTFLKNNKDAGVIWFDSEFAMDKEFIRKRDIDEDRFFTLQPETIQDFRTKSLKFLESYIEKNSTKPLMFVLDSLGNLSTTKEMADSTAGSETKDMTRAQIIRSTFRTLTLRLGKAGVPLFICNHTYDQMDQYKPKEISGGGGAKFASSTIITLTKAKDRDDKTNEVVGNIIKATTYKSRFSKEQKMIELKLDYNKGIDKYHGLLGLAEKAEIFEKITSQKYKLTDGTEVKGTEIRANPEKYFTKDILDRIDVFCNAYFGLGDHEENNEEILVKEE